MIAQFAIMFLMIIFPQLIMVPARLVLLKNLTAHRA